VTYLAGADGCKAGWIVIYKNLDESTIHSCVVDRIEMLFESLDVTVLAIDIPIGLTESGPRECDIQARREIGPRLSSVFPAPIRAVIAVATHSEASRISRELQNRGMSKQAFAICPKIRAVDEVLRTRPLLRERIYEVHPEVTFRTWNGAAMVHPKKSSSGKADRLHLVKAHFGGDSFDAVRAAHRRALVQADDILDAFAALWTAERIMNGTARTLPPSPPVDATLLPMRIVC
jgi:predicted RNase H-like nuclease